jgi:DNA replication protein DnaC
VISEKKINRIADRIRNECDCSKLGCGICAAKISRMKSYAKASIPVVYWNLPFKSFTGDVRFGEHIRGILQNINKFYDDGTSYAFIGNLGTGKSYAACCILKSAIVEGFDCKYTQMAQIVNNLLSSNDNTGYLEELLEYDVLVIDEFDPRWVFPSEKVERIFGSNLEYILRTRFQNGMPTIVCSNAADIDVVLTNDFAKAFSSLRNMYMKVLVVTGKDFRKAGAV